MSIALIASRRSTASVASAPRVFGALLAIALALGAVGAHADETAVDADALRSGAATDAGSATRYRAATTDDGRYRISTRFETFDGEALDVAFELPAGASRKAVQEFGIADVELAALLQACRASRRCDQDTLDARTTRYYREHALRLRYVAGSAPHLYVDVAQVVQRNRTRVQPVAAALRRLAAEQGRSTQWAINAAVALVQSGLVYRKPALLEDGRRILGFYPPPRALERGYGDCDTKAALLAAILQNLTDAPIVGVHVPQHYLLGIAATPGSTQATLQYEGRPYVLVEASGPGRRRPGDIAERTRLALASGDGVRVDPMF